jgi:hypothetical protein
MKIESMDCEQLLWTRDTSEEALTSKMFRNDPEYLQIHNDSETILSKEKIEIISM